MKQPFALLAWVMMSAAACAQNSSVTDTPAPEAPAATSAVEASPDESVLAQYEHREMLGFALMVNRGFIDTEPAMLDRVLLQLEADLDEITHILPEPALAAVRRTTIWVELQGAKNGGMSGRGMCCHWSADWLESVGLPREKAGGVEIVNAEDFLAWRRTQPYMLLHELAHAYHRMIGPDLPEIMEPYKAAIEAGLYDEVGRNSVPTDDTVKAYAATNHHEYFAELSEAYFALNDFVPYTRSQLAALDPIGLAMVEKLWNLSAAEIETHIEEAGMLAE